MDNLKKYLDELFSQLPNSMRANTLKSEILTNMEKRYQELMKQNIEINQVEKQLIDEIGTVEEIRKKINFNSKKESIVSAIEVFIFIITFGFSIYASSNDHVFSSNYNNIPRIISTILTKPISLFLGTVLILTIIEYIIKPQKDFLKNKRIRLTLLIISIFLIALYLLMIFSIMGPIHIFMKSSYLIYKKINIIAVITGIFYYLGRKK